jgi:hypothetical protein
MEYQPTKKALFQLLKKNQVKKKGKAKPNPSLSIVIVREFLEKD